MDGDAVLEDILNHFSVEFIASWMSLDRAPTVVLMPVPGVKYTIDRIHRDKVRVLSSSCAGCKFQNFQVDAETLVSLAERMAAAPRPEPEATTVPGDAEVDEVDGPATKATESSGPEGKGDSS